MVWKKTAHPSKVTKFVAISTQKHNTFKSTLTIQSQVLLEDPGAEPRGKVKQYFFNDKTRWLMVSRDRQLLKTRNQEGISYKLARAENPNLSCNEWPEKT